MFESSKHVAGADLPYPWGVGGMLQLPLPWFVVFCVLKGIMGRAARELGQLRS